MGRAFFITWMEGFSRALGRTTRSMAMDVNKDLLSMKDNGNMD